MAADEDLLFCNGDLQATIAGHFKKTVEKVNAIPPDQFLASDNDTLVEHIVSELVLHRYSSDG